jgi:hypothetical protein
MPRLLHRTRALCAAAVLAQFLPASAQPVPEAARKVIGQVHRAAKANDIESLRKHMIEEFTWNFGGDGNAEQAIAAWKAQPGHLRQLARVTRLQCAFRSGQYIECPVDAGTNFRAGFKLTDGQWKMQYFVEGD